MQIGDGLMKTVHTLSEAKKTYVLIEREHVNETYKIRYTDSDDVIEIVPSSKKIQPVHLLKQEIKVLYLKLLLPPR